MVERPQQSKWYQLLLQVNSINTYVGAPQTQQGQSSQPQQPQQPQQQQQQQQQQAGRQQARVIGLPNVMLGTIAIPADGAPPDMNQVRIS